MKRFFILFICLIGLSHVGNTQIVKRISLSLNNESLAIPFTRFLPLHLGTEIGLTFFERGSDKLHHNLSAQVGFFHHKKLETAVYLKAVYQPIFRIKEKLGIAVPLSLGYLHSIPNQTTYQLNTSTGLYEAKASAGNPSMIGGLGIELSYIGWERFRPFIQQETCIRIAPSSVFPLLVHSFVKIGFSYSIRWAKS